MIASVLLVMALAEAPKDKETVPPELLEKRIEELGDAEASVREHAACELAAMGATAGRAVPALMKALEREVRLTAPGPRSPGGGCSMNRRFSSLNLWAFERRAREPIPFALRRLHGSERGAAAVLEMIRREPGLRFVPQETASILGKLGPEAVPAFARALREPNAQIRYVAVVALGQVEPASKAVLAVLRKAVEEQSGDVQHEAAAALDAIQSRRVTVANTSR